MNQVVTGRFQSKAPNKSNAPKSDKIKNLPAFIRGYTKNEYGQRVVSRPMGTVLRHGKPHWSNPVLAQALLKAAQPQQTA